MKSTTMRLAFWLCLASVSYLALAPQEFVIAPGASDNARHAFAFATLGLLGAAACPKHVGPVFAP